MGKYILLLCMLPAMLSAQTDSLKELLNYYPLQKGNYWQYKNYFEQMPFPPSDSNFYSIQVAGDTLLDNGHSYKILKYTEIFPNNYAHYYYERIDSSTGCVYRYINDSTAGHEYMSDSLFASEGDTIYSSRDRISQSGYYITKCISIKDDSIFGMQTLFKTYFDQSFLPGVQYTFAKGLGIVSSSSCEMGCSNSSLVYALVNDKEYGQKITAVRNDANNLPMAFKLYQNYPNPFNPTTTIEYSLSKPEHVVLKVYDELGREITTLVDDEQNAGNYRVQLNAQRTISSRQLSSGIYYYKLSAGKFSAVKKLLLLK